MNPLSYEFAGETSTITHKKAMIDALRESLGIISTACSATGVSRQTHYNWIDEDPEYVRAYKDIAETAIDFAESKLFQLMNGVTVEKKVPDAGGKMKTVTYKTEPNIAATIFYLKTKGKGRGFVERAEFDHTTNGKDINLPAISFTKEDDAG